MTPRCKPCRTCGAPIWFAINERSGRRVCLNPKRTKASGWLYERSERQGNDPVELRVRVVQGEGWQAHQETCQVMADAQRKAAP